MVYLKVDVVVSGSHAFYLLFPKQSFGRMLCVQEKLLKDREWWEGQEER